MPWRPRPACKMPPRQTIIGVSDDLFSSGPWTGFYNYQPGDWHRMDLDLAFAEGSTLPWDQAVTEALNMMEPLMS